MSRWLDLAAEMLGGAEPCANSANRANSPPDAPNGTNGTNGTALPAALAAGLASLRAKPAPRITRPDVWPEIVADAERLARCGWAAQALALGWEPLQLFGCSPAAGGIADLEGLAVWLAGRRIILLDSRSVIVANGPRSRSIFNRRSMDGAVFLWELGVRGHGR